MPHSADSCNTLFFTFDDLHDQGEQIMRENSNIEEQISQHNLFPHDDQNDIVKLNDIVDNLDDNDDEEEKEE